MCPDARASGSGTVVEIKERLDGTLATYHCQGRAFGPGEAVVCFPLQRAFNLHGVALPAGSFSYGYFWESRPYNVYHFLGPEGRTRVLYCNISDSTRITEREIRWRDLVVDVLIDSQGRARVVDEDELPVDLSADLHYRIDAAREALLADAPRLVSELETRSAAFLQ